MSPEKVLKLIALAANNSSENEARTAALLACKAIAAERLVLLLPTDPRLALHASPPATWPPPGWAPSEWQHPGSPTSSTAWKKSTQSPRPDPSPDDPRRISVRFESRCVVCSLTLPEGTRAWWRKGDGCWCLAHGKSREAA